MTCISREAAVLKMHPRSTGFNFQTARQVPRLAVVLVGWGANKGSRLTAAVLAHRLRLSWPTGTCHKEANYNGSLMQAALLTWAWSKKARSFQSGVRLAEVVVRKTANTEHFSEVIPGLSDTAENLLRTIQLGLEVSPSMLFAVASILEGCSLLGGSPLTMLVPGTLEFKWQCSLLVGGDDLRSGQTKVKSVLVDLLICSGHESIERYNHLGNNDRQNLSTPPQFRSKEVSKSSVVDDTVHSTPALY
ncbi:inositol-3-phosphate synthase 1 [Pontoporia blainvillei]|uniref:Inositol-3-phosphate synthase 1 n=1 Tax=Pontoporia blainvillei TaxID=48723 RepID=A0ABX0S3B2_PONBL|nr:inositol-3-phosphate synthase 1 [Pontoporia blainvillei]